MSTAQPTHHFPGWLSAMNRLSAFSVLILISVAPASASANMMRGPGVSTCGTWTKNRQSDVIQSAWSEFWVLGYLNRASLQHSGDILESANSDGINAWIDNYCSAHPLDLIVDAADQLENELAARVAPSPKRRK